MTMLNFNSLPEESTKRNVGIGRHRLVIRAAIVELTAKKKKALIVTNNVVGNSKPDIRDWYTCFDENGNPEHFGQYKLKKLLEAVGVVPEGDFTLEVIPTLIEGKEYYGVLKYQGDDEKYLEIAHPDADGNFERVEGTVVPETTEIAQTPNEPSPEVKTALDNDNIL